VDVIVFLLGNVPLDCFGYQQNGDAFFDQSFNEVCSLLGCEEIIFHCGDEGHVFVDFLHSGIQFFVLFLSRRTVVG